MTTLHRTLLAWSAHYNHCSIVQPTCGDAKKIFFWKKNQVIHSSCWLQGIRNRTIKPDQHKSKALVLLEMWGRPHCPCHAWVSTIKYSSLHVVGQRSHSLFVVDVQVKTPVCVFMWGLDSRQNKIQWDLRLWQMWFCKKEIYEKNILQHKPF